MNCVKDALWRARNICLFKKYEIPARVVVNGAFNLLNDYFLRENIPLKKGV